MLLNPFRFGVEAGGGDGALLAGLVSHWKLDEGSGNAIDAHGTNHLTDVNTVGTAVGRVGNARYFNRASQETLSISSNSSLQTGNISFTLAAWVKFYSFPTADHGTIVSKDDGGSSREYTLYYNRTTANIHFDLYPLGTLSGATGIGFLNQSSIPFSWNFLVAWYDSVADKMYSQRNNGAINEWSQATGTFVGSARFRIGALAYTTESFNAFFDGLIDEVSLWKRVLTDDERTRLYNGGNGLAYPFDGPVLPPVSPLLSGLVSYWKLDEVSGNALDAHGQNTLTDTNTVTSAPGKIGNARDFEATNTEYFTIASNPSLQLGDIEYTFTVWFKLESASAGQVVFSKDNLSSSREHILLYDNAANRLSFYIFPNGSTATAVVSNAFGPMSIEVWYFVACWHDPVANKIYIQVNNGGIDEAAASGGAFVGSSPFQIGAAAGGILFDGLIDELGFWKRVLTPAERTELYNSGNGKTYPFT